METKDLQQEINGTAVAHSSLTLEQKEKKRLAKRIIKTIQGPLDDAMRMEAELGRKPFEKELANLDALFDRNIRARTQSIVTSTASAALEGATSVKAPSVDDPADRQHKMEIDHHDGHPDDTRQEHITDDMVNGISITDEHLQASAEEGVAHEEAQRRAGELDPNQVTDEAIIRLQVGPGSETIPISNSGDRINELVGAHPDANGDSIPSLSNSGSTNPSTTHPDPPSPEIKEQDLLAPLKYGGILWYAQPFDPDGTTVYEERWTGRDVLRHLSEELSDMDEEDMKALQDEEDVKVLQDEDMTDAPLSTAADDEELKSAAPRQPAKKKKKPRNYR